MMNFLIDSKSIGDDVIQIQSRSMSDPTFSDTDFKNKMAWIWTTLKIFFDYFSENYNKGDSGDFLWIPKFTLYMNFVIFLSTFQN